MQVSIIVPVRNEARHLPQVLERLTSLDFPNDDYEILVIDGGSDDGTPEVANRFQIAFKNLRMIHNPRRLSSAARNLGVSHARGKYIVIVDGHCDIPDDRYLQHLVEAFENTGADSLGRPQPLTGGRLSTFQQAVALARSSWLGHNPDSAIFSDVPKFVPAQNVAVAYRRQLFDEVGTFDERFDACEDVEFNTRLDLANKRCYFTPSLKVAYVPPPSI